jgi:nicotinamide-nucleotide adenylyltransferase
VSVALCDTRAPCEAAVDVSDSLPILPDRVSRIAMIARWKPVHLGHAAVLEALADRADHAIIGIGSSNKYDASNPFTSEETAAMIRLVLAGRGNIELVDVPDLGHGPRWRAMVVGMFGPLDLFATANAYVRSLLEHDYRVVHPVWLIAPDRRVAVDGTMVRRRMARADDWRALVPPSIAAFLDEHGLVDRFRREFGAQTIALEEAEKKLEPS